MTEKTKYLLGFVLTTSVFLTFQLTYFNRFLPIEDGWFVEYAKQAGDGKLIYKDFHVFIQPVYVFIFRCLSYFFGYSLIVFRYYGLLERVLLLGMTYLLFAQITSAYRAVFLTLLGMFVYVMNTTDVIYSYYQFVAVLLFASAYCLMVFYRTGRYAAVTLAGLISGLAFMTKHSVGTVVPATLLLTIAAMGYARLNPSNKTWKPVGLFMLGLTVPIVLILGVFWHLRILGPYWTQVFGGAASKGSLTNVLFRFWERMLTPSQFLVVASLAALFSWLAWKATRSATHDDRVGRWTGGAKYYWSITGMILLATAGLTPLLMSYPRDFGTLDTVYDRTHFFTTINQLAYVSMYFNASVVLYYICRVIVRTVGAEEIPRLIVTVVSFAFMYGHGLSGVIEPHAAVIGSGLLAASLLNTRVLYDHVKNAAVYLFIIFVVTLSAFGKAAWMYSWWGWDERVAWTATQESREPLLRGFGLNGDKIEVIEGITSAIREYSSPGDAIYVFPHIPLFYLLADRPHNTFGSVHYFDVCPDSLARSDAQIVADTAPKVIVNMEFPDDVWALHEDLFRGGMRSGQRDIRELIERFKASGRYKVVRTYVTTGYNYRIEVLAKNGPP